MTDSVPRFIPPKHPLGLLRE